MHVHVGMRSGPSPRSCRRRSRSPDRARSGWTAWRSCCGSLASMTPSRHLATRGYRQAAAGAARDLSVVTGEVYRAPVSEVVAAAALAGEGFRVAWASRHGGEFSCHAGTRASTHRAAARHATPSTRCRDARPFAGVGLSRQRAAAPIAAIRVGFACRWSRDAPCVRRRRHVPRSRLTGSRATPVR
jgi:hypothetical protein